MPITQKTLNFLVENKARNSRDWFLANKVDYEEHVLAPFQELVENLTPAMLDLDDMFLTSSRRCLSRLNRDVRFSKDKSLYRDRMWCVFTRDKHMYPEPPPAFFFETMPQGWRFGCGHYQTPPPIMRAMREILLSGDKQTLSMLRHMEKQTVFTLEGESYKRTRHPQADEKLRSWLDRKSMTFIHTSDNLDLLFQKDFWKHLAKGFKTLRPFYDFSLTAAKGLCPLEPRWGTTSPPDPLLGHPADWLF